MYGLVKSVLMSKSVDNRFTLCLACELPSWIRNERKYKEYERKGSK